MSRTVVHKRNGVGVCSVLFMIFAVLKMTGNIDWSWWWVTAPLWIPLAFIGLVFAAVGGVAFHLARKEQLK